VALPADIHFSGKDRRTADGQAAASTTLASVTDDFQYQISLLRTPCLRQQLSIKQQKPQICLVSPWLW